MSAYPRRRFTRGDRMGQMQLTSVVPSQPRSSLVGRDTEAEEVLRRMGQAPLVTLTGPPGVGKSRLAFEVGSQVREMGRPGAVVVNVERLSQPRQVAPAVSRALEEVVTSREGAESGDGPLVVILDDCDRLLTACGDVAYSLLGEDLRILATAREPLRVECESVWRVPPLPVPPPHCEGMPEVLTESAAVQLFYERAAPADRGFVATPDTIPAVAEICRRLDGVPLAIELAARTVTAYSPAEITARLDAPFSLLANGPRTAHPRHQSLWACLAWSYDLLSVPQQVVLERLAVFAGTFREAAAVQVCAAEGMTEVEVAGILRTLVDKSLVAVETHAGGTRYRLFEMVRWFGAEKLAGRGEEQAQREQHARWCTEMVRAAGDPRQGRPWLERLDPCHDDLHAALECALASGANETAVRLGLADIRLCRARGQYRPARNRTRQLAAVAAPPALHARALVEAGTANASAGEMEVALAQLREAVAVAEDAGDHTESGRAHLWLASTRAVACGRVALAALEAAVFQARERGDPHLVVDGLAALGRADLLLGDLARSHEAFTESSQVAADHGDEVGQAQALVGLGAAAVAIGHYAEAEAVLNCGLELAQAVGEVEAACVALSRLGEADRLRGKAGAAEAWFVQAAELAAVAENPYAETQALLGLGRIAEGRGDSSLAGQKFEAALATARAGSVVCLVAPSLCGMAQLTGDPVKARALLSEALTAARAWGDQVGEALALEHLARLREDQRDLSGAAARHRQALALRVQIGDPAAVALSLEALAFLAAARGAVSVAPRLLGAAEALRERHGCARLGSQSDENASFVQHLREALGDDVFTTERLRGTALSPQAALALAVRHGGKRLPRADAGWDALTAAERRVAELAAEGRTNVEIGQQLGIAPATVKAHLRRAFAKLSVGNRTAMAAALQSTDESGPHDPQP